MKKSLFACAFVASMMLAASCGSAKYAMVNAPQESGIVFTRVTPENASVVQSTSYVARYLALSNDGRTLAYLSKDDNNTNIYTLDVYNTSISQQRTYRNNVTGGFSFSRDDKYIAFGTSDAEILTTDSKQGSICKQIGTGWAPEYSADGKYLFFHRNNGNGEGIHSYNIWSFDLSSHETSMYGEGFEATKSIRTKSEIYVLQRAKRGTRTFDEIRRIDYKTGNNVVILSDEDMSATAMSISPDGNWIAFSAKTFSHGKWSSTQQLYVMRTDGTELTQLTYHAAGSFSPVWSKDGSSIYFISGRGSKTKKFAIWKMNYYR